MFTEQVYATKLALAQKYDAYYIALDALTSCVRWPHLWMHEGAWSAASVQASVLKARDQALRASHAVSQIWKYQLILELHTREGPEEEPEAPAAATCNICTEPLPASELRNRTCVCPCGFQICASCVHKITEEYGNKCPQCRAQYEPGRSVPVRRRATPDTSSALQPDTDPILKRCFAELRYQTPPVVDAEGREYLASCSSFAEYAKVRHEYYRDINKLRAALPRASMEAQRARHSSNELYLHIERLETCLAQCAAHGFALTDVPPHMREERCVLQAQEHRDWLLENMERVQCMESQASDLQVACHALLADVERLRAAHPELPSAAVALCLRAELNEKLRTYAGGPVTRQRKRLCVSRSSDAHV